MARKSFNLDSNFYCVFCCSKGIPIARVNGKNREAGHLKKLFCLTCQRETNHVECKEGTRYDFDDFEFEYVNHNFDDYGNRIMPYGEFRDTMHKKGAELP